MTTDSLGTASIAAVRQYLRLAQAEGLDWPGALAAAGLSADVLDEGSERIEGGQFQRLIRELTLMSGDPLLGLRSGDYVQPGSYNVLGYITMSCSTLGEAVARIGPYEKLVGDMGVTRMHQEGDQLKLSWHCAYPDPMVRPQMIDNVFASWINYARWLGDYPEAAATAIALERPSPGPDLEPEYQRRWRCPVTFDAPSSSITLPRSLLDIPLRQPDPLLRKTLEAHAMTQIAALDDDSTLINRVRQAIRHQLQQGITRQDMVAEHIRMNARTLQRRLSQEGLSYQRLLDEERRELAEYYLRESSLPIPDIALRLGFSEVRSFHRSFKGWSGLTPGEFRGR